MKSVLGSLFVVGALVAGSASLYAAPQATADKTIDDRVEARINADATLKKRQIVVTTDNGVVTLTGMVSTPAESSKAAALANVNGVTRVNNNLVVSKDVKDSVKGTTGKVVDKTEEGAKKVGEVTKDAAIKTKDGAVKVYSKTGEEITDGWITSRVHSKYVGEDLLKDSDINVDTQDHVVILKGTVMSAAAKSRAEAQAKEVEGVRRVVNQLVVGPKKP